jgi:hypothetical protein
VPGKTSTDCSCAATRASTSRIWLCINTISANDSSAMKPGSSQLRQHRTSTSKSGDTSPYEAVLLASRPPRLELQPSSFQLDTEFCRPLVTHPFVLACRDGAWLLFLLPVEVAACFHDLGTWPAVYAGGVPRSWKPGLRAVRNAGRGRCPLPTRPGNSGHASTGRVTQRRRLGRRREPGPPGPCPGRRVGSIGAARARGR